MYQTQAAVLQTSLAENGTGWHVFTFHYNPNITNCISMGPRCEVSGPYNAKVANIHTPAGETRFDTASGQTFATIQWSNLPVVEITGSVLPQYASQFLSLQLAPDLTSSYRRMNVGGKSYNWTERGTAGTYLYKAGDFDSTDPVARVRIVDSRTVVLEMKGEAFPAGLFQPCIAATVLLYSGRNFG
ncbi:hypothetical protein CPC08DRAFT_731443 [Agrocybe pediades]|nr:hypothetical protein CPC08DRAFT_731443 [Agrocybe pediades]